MLYKNNNNFCFNKISFCLIFISFVSSIAINLLIASIQISNIFLLSFLRKKKEGNNNNISSI